MVAVGSLDYTKKKLLEIRAAVDREIARLGGNPDLEAIVEKLSHIEKESSEKRPQPALRLSTEVPLAE